MIGIFQGNVLIKCPGKFDFRIIEKLEKEVSDLIKEGKASFLIDLSQCIFIDSASLSFIVRLYKKCRELDGSLKICCVKHPKVLKIFQLTKLDEILYIYEDITEALNN